MISIGLEQLLAGEEQCLAGWRLGLLSNQASTDRRLRHTRLLLQQRFGRGLTCLFSPQHGFFSEKQDNMIESEHAVDGETGLPLFSLYGDSRRPSPEMFKKIDILVIDLIDVGTRVYTFLSTMAYCLEEAAHCGIRVIVLDRPNPTGGETIEGNILRPECSSFIGLYPLPMRHGLTFGELALFINGEAALGCDLKVVPMLGWRRSMRFREIGFPWVFPSPNMPTPETALVYPGQVLWEGTNVSEGRGTTLPFELVGAPYWDCRRILATLESTPLPGCYLRPLVFEPTSGKWTRQACNGFQLHVTNDTAFRPYRTGLALLQAILQLYPDQFHYKQPPYEYEFERLPLDLILGDGEVRRQLEEGMPILALEQGWQRELEAFEERRRQYFLYY